jgi:ABC-type lipoprotein export system ATPase subunit
MGEILQVRNLNRVYRTGSVRVTALRNVDLDVAEGGFLGIAGSSGSGKSTLLNLLGGLDTPSSGSIRCLGREIASLSPAELARHRRETVGMIFQAFHLIPSLTAEDNIALPLLFANIAGRERRARARELLEWMGLAARAAHRPSELSGGEQQRVAIARALVNRPRILLADEPTGNLDSIISREIVDLLARLNRERGVTVLMVSHEQALLREYAHEMCLLRDGEVVLREGRT